MFRGRNDIGRWGETQFRHDRVLQSPGYLIDHVGHVKH